MGDQVRARAATAASRERWHPGRETDAFGDRTVKATTKWHQGYTSQDLYVSHTTSEQVWP